MKRLIKYWNTFSSDGARFSDCSTKYEILPMIVADEADEVDLIMLADHFNVPLLTSDMTVLKPENKWDRSLSISHALKVDEVKKGRGMYSDEVYQVYLGFITLPKPFTEVLKPINAIDVPVNEEQVYEIINNQVYGVDQVGETVDGGIVLVKGGWNYYHEIKLLGYSLESFEEAAGITEHGFYDDTSSCNGCNKYDSNDNNYTYNFRYVESTGELLGVNCGCFDEFCKSEEGLSHYQDNADEAMELSTAQEHESNGKLKHLERFIGGMVDGRGGYWRGYGSTRESTPEKALKEYQEKAPGKSFIFSHDESGQFQTYFSIWEVIE